jgi:hypothetical protein
VRRVAVPRFLDGDTRPRASTSEHSDAAMDDKCNIATSGSAPDDELTAFHCQCLPCFRMTGIAHRGVLRSGFDPVYVADSPESTCGVLRLHTFDQKQKSHPPFCYVASQCSQQPCGTNFNVRCFVVAGAPQPSSRQPGSVSTYARPKNKAGMSLPT